MNLHENKELFVDAIIAASQAKVDGGLGVKQVFIEKDYWISRSLKLLSESADAELAVFKGGTSLSKAYGMGARFSEDIDIAIINDEQRTDNQTKSLVSRITHTMSCGLKEVVMPKTRKFSKYRKVYYAYPMLPFSDSPISIKPGMIQLEVVSFANPYPFRKVRMGSMLMDFLLQAGRKDIVDEYGMGAFEVNVLDLKRTATEKLVSLFRHSLADDFISELRAKIRHFYDLYFLWQDVECKRYLQSEEFKNDFQKLFLEDQERFKEPDGWQNRLLCESPLFVNLNAVWDELKSVYESELPELAYRSVPKADVVVDSFRDLIRGIHHCV